MSGDNPYWRAISHQLPDLVHLLVTDGDAAIGPVQSEESECHITGLVWQTMNHDAAAGIEPPGRSLFPVFSIGIGNVDGLVEIAVGVTPIQHIFAFGGTLVSLVELVP